MIFIYQYTHETSPTKWKDIKCALQIHNHKNRERPQSIFLSTTVTVSFVFLPPLWKFALAKGWISWGYIAALSTLLTVVASVEDHLLYVLIERRRRSN